MSQFIALSSEAIANGLLTIRSDVAYAKNHPIYKARDDKEAAALNTYWLKIKDSDGSDDLAIAAKSILDEVLEGQIGATQNVINL